MTQRVTNHRICGSWRRFFSMRGEKEKEGGKKKKERGGEKGGEKGGVKERGKIWGEI